jgi:hypothetical protein
MQSFNDDKKKFFAIITIVTHNQTTLKELATKTYTPNLFSKKCERFSN